MECKIGLALPDIRLDFINNIDPQFIDMMTVMRAEFIGMDNKLRIMGGLEAADKPGVARCMALARTHLETALQYGIKSLCIMGEVKE